MRRTTPLLAVALPAVAFLAACVAGEDSATPLDIEARLSAHGGSSGFPVVIVRQGPGTGQAGGARAPVVDDLGDALVLVATGGTIKVDDGTYPGLGLPIDRPVTIEALGNASPVIEGTTDLCFTVKVDGVTGGPVVLRGLTLDGETACGIALALGGTHDLVLVEEMVFAEGSVLIEPVQNATGPLVLRNSAFPGPSGIFGDAAGDVEVSGNSFTGPGTVVHLAATDAVISGNTFTNCRGNPDDPLPVGCISVGGPWPDGTLGAARVEDNTITVDITDDPDARIPSGIFVNITSAGDSHTISGNVITGIGRNSSAADIWGEFPLTLAGIELVDGAVADVSGNRITNAFQAIQIGFPVSVTGLDNVVDDVHVGISSFPGSEVEVRSSDFTGYEFSMQIHGSDPDKADLTCNWWGSPDGPTNAGAPDPSVYTPWAEEPVAGTSTTECEGGL